MLTLSPVSEHSPELPRVARLMERAFPAHERVPMRWLTQNDGHELLAVLEDGAFCGFISLLTRGDLCHILFFAIEEDVRGRGLGSRALTLLREHKPNVRLIADVEAIDEKAANAPQRERRQRFYLRQGYRPTGIRYRWRGEDYVILASGGPVTEAEFWHFWGE